MMSSSQPAQSLINNRIFFLRLLVVPSLVLFFGLTATMGGSTTDNSIDSTTWSSGETGSPGTVTCYNCDSTLDPLCADPFNKSDLAVFALTCKSTAELGCYKSKNTILDLTTVKRGCQLALANSNNKCLETIPGDVVFRNCSCLEDRCNQAARVYQNTQTIFFSLATFLFAAILTSSFVITTSHQ